MCTWGSVVERHTKCPLANRGTCDLLSLIPFIPFCLSVGPSASPILSLMLSLYVYPQTACRPQSHKLSIHGASQHFEKVKAADQSGLERQSTQRPQCEPLFLPQSPLLTPLSAGCGRRYLRVITPNGGLGRTQVP